MFQIFLTALCFVLVLLPVSSDNSPYVDFMRGIVEDLNKRKADSFNAALDKDAFLEKVFHGLPSDNEKIQEFRTEIQKGLDQAGDTLISSMNDAAVLKYIRMKPGEEKRALVRVHMGDQGLTFIEFILGEDAEHKIRILDWYNYSIGQNYSYSLRQFIPLVVPGERSIMLKLFLLKSISDKDVRKLTSFFQAFGNKNYDLAIFTYNTLPDNLKENRLLLLVRLKIASVLDDQEVYQNTLADINQYHGEDPRLCLMLIDHFYYKEAYDQALAALKSLDQYTGGDATIDDLMASVYFVQNNYEKAMEFADKAIQREPGLEDPYWTLLECQVHSGKYQEAIEQILIIEKKFKYRMDPKELAKLPGYEKFSASVWFTTWSNKLTS